VNITEIESRERDLKARALELKQQLHASQTKNFRGLDIKAMEVEMAALQAESERLKFYRGRAEAMSNKNYAALRDGASALGHESGPVKNGRRTGREVNPLALPNRP
jgi:hypothetical protein